MTSMLDLVFFIFIIGIAVILVVNLITAPVIQELKLCYIQSNQALEKTSLYAVNQDWLSEKILLRSQGQDPQFEECKRKIPGETGIPISLVNLLNFPLQQKDKGRSLGY